MVAAADLDQMKIYRVSEEGWTPSGEDTPETLSSADLTPGFKVAFVHLGIDLSAAFDQIQGGHGSVCDALFQA